MPPKPIDRSAAWVALTTNLLVLPGVGSWMAGQRMLGVTQILMSLAGMFLMTAWLCLFLFQWLRDEQMPRTLGPHLWLAIAGVVIFSAAWLWSLASSVALIRRAGATALKTDTPPRVQ